MGGYGVKTGGKQKGGFRPGAGRPAHSGIKKGGKQTKTLLKLQAAELEANRAKLVEQYVEQAKKNLDEKDHAKYVNLCTEDCFRLMQLDPVYNMLAYGFQNPALFYSTNFKKIASAPIETKGEQNFNFTLTVKKTDVDPLLKSKDATSQIEDIEYTEE